MNPPAATRGRGLLEGFLARKRCAMANTLIPESARAGAVIDVGCGSYPLFLHNTAFARKTGVDRVTDPAVIAACAGAGIGIRPCDIAREPLPCEDGVFAAATMLAVIEHIPPDRLPALMAEVHRVLKPGGLFVVTTPAWWTDGILRTMARLRLVSPEEIDEHASAFRPADLVAVLAEGGFNRGAIRTGAFELGMNLWATARKDTA